MYIYRDITNRLLESHSPVQFLIGPRQCGKSTLLAHLPGVNFQEITFDDFHFRQLANRDPALFLDQFKPPVLLDEVQYAPNLFPEIKRRVDELKKSRLKTGESLNVLFRMTGSNQLLIDKNIKESLAGRVSYYDLNTLSVHEIQNSFADLDIGTIIFKGGWPELYIDRTLSPVQYLNDYARSYIEKDIILSSGVQKHQAFTTVLGLLAARSGMLLDYANVSRDGGIQAVTVKEWVGLLERTSLAYCLKPYMSNLNKRLTKTPKFYFLDTGLVVRLQGWQEKLPMLMSPQIGSVFETLVLSEIVKFIRNYGKDWQLYLWRTREGDKVDFLIETEQGKVIALDAKMSIQNAQSTTLSTQFKKMFPKTKEIVLVTFRGDRVRLSSNCLSIPISQLHDFLLEEGR